MINRNAENRSVRFEILCVLEVDAGLAQRLLEFHFHASSGVRQINAQSA
jgi:hypothetical protein